MSMNSLKTWFFGHSHRRMRLRRIGDLVLIATDGILEVRAEAKRGFRLNDSVEVSGLEFGVEAIGRLLEANSTMPLPQLAERILKETRAFGKQFDDQTLLLVRRTAATLG
jgi:serine phosphatase RsbU (regulator of sigma subunit)